MQLEEREGELEESEGGIGGEIRGWVERGGNWRIDYDYGIIVYTCRYVYYIVRTS